MRLAILPVWDRLSLDKWVSRPPVQAVRPRFFPHTLTPSPPSVLLKAFSPFSPFPSSLIKASGSFPYFKQ